MSKYIFRLISSEPTFVGSVSRVKYEITNSPDNTNNEAADIVSVVTQANVRGTQANFSTKMEGNVRVVELFLFLSAEVNEITVSAMPDMKSFTDTQTVPINSSCMFHPATVIFTGNTDRSLLNTFAGALPPQDEAHIKTYKFKATFTAPSGPWIHITSGISNLVNQAFFTNKDDMAVMQMVDKVTNMAHVYVMAPNDGLAELNVSLETPQWANMQYTTSTGLDPLGILAFFNPALVNSNIPAPQVSPASINTGDGNPDFMVTVPASSALNSAENVDVLINKKSISLDPGTISNQPLIKTFPKTILNGSSKPGGLLNNTEYLIYREGGAVNLSQAANFSVMSPKIDIELTFINNPQPSDNSNSDTVRARLTTTVNGTTSPVPIKSITFSVTDANSSVNSVGTKTFTTSTDATGTRDAAIFNGSGKDVDVLVTCTINDADMDFATTTVRFTAPQVQTLFTLSSIIDRDNALSDNTDPNTIVYSLLADGVPASGRSLNVTSTDTNTRFIDGANLVSSLTKPINQNGSLTVDIVNGSRKAVDVNITCRLVDGTPNNPAPVTNIVHFRAPSDKPDPKDNFHIDYVVKNSSQATANGTDLIDVIATLSNNGVLVPNTDVRFFTSPDADGIIQQSGTTIFDTKTDPDGRVQFQVHSNANRLKDYIISGELAGTSDVIDTTVIKFLAPSTPVQDVFRITLSANPASGVKADGTEQSVVTASVTKNGNPAPNVPMTISVNGSAFFPFNNMKTASITTESQQSGTGGLGFTAIRVRNNGNRAETVTVTCRLDSDPSVNATTTIGFVAATTPTPDVFRITLSASPASGVRANGSDVSVVTATVFRNNVLAPNVPLTISVNGSAFFPFNNMKTASITTESQQSGTGGLGFTAIRVSNNGNRAETVTVSCRLANGTGTAATTTIGFVAATVIRRIFKLFMQPTADTARVQPYAYPTRTDGACHVTAKLLDQNNSPAPAGTIVNCYIDPQPNAYFRIISYNNIDILTPNANLPVNANGEVNLRIAQWQATYQGKPSSYAASQVHANYDGQIATVNLKWFL